MCIIVYNPAGLELNKTQMRIAYDNNPHGFGLMWNDNNKVHSIKSFADFNGIWSMLQHFTGTSYALHFRWRTTGSIVHDQCHPHRVLSKKRHGVNMQMMHNGTINHIKAQKDLSDSQIFAEQMKKQYVSAGNLHNMFENIRTAQSSFGNNKFVFMADHNYVEILNEEAGKWLANVWYSNLYSFEPGYRNKNNFKKKNKKGGPRKSTVFYSKNGIRCEVGENL